MTARVRVAALAGIIAAAIVVAGCQTGTASPGVAPGFTTTKCPGGWVCAPGTSQCDPSYKCGTCPDTKDNDNDGDSWSYLDDGSAVARKGQADSKLGMPFNTSQPCGPPPTASQHRAAIQP